MGIDGSHAVSGHELRLLTALFNNSDDFWDEYFWAVGNDDPIRQAVIRAAEKHGIENLTFNNVRAELQQ
jgi:hypothetical protein